jgi:hypothetical protein
MMDMGVGSDMLSLGLPPLHIAPFFLYNVRIDAGINFFACVLMSSPNTARRLPSSPQNDYRTVEARGVDTNERYYEVPHWMHLSFINYDRDDGDDVNATRREEQAARTNRQPWLDAFEVAANGFLRNQMSADSTHLHASSSQLRSKPPASTFSAMGNAAATPGKAKLTQERQLISGRDFWDIVEACRPRISRINAPSALKVILQVHQHVEDMEKAQTSGTEFTKKKKSWKIMPLREWGTVDYSEFGVRPKHESAQMRNETGRKLPLVDNSDIKSEGSDSGSASSFASHVSSVFGLSYDRVLWGQFDSPATSRKAIQLQRSPSLEFEKLGSSQIMDSDTELREDSTSMGADAGSRSSIGKGDTVAEEIEPAGDSDTNASLSSKQKKHADHLRKIMAARDVSAFSPLPSKIDSDHGVVHPDHLHDSELSTTPKAGLLTQNL